MTSFDARFSAETLRRKKESEFIAEHSAPVRAQTFLMLDTKEGRMALKREAKRQKKVRKEAEAREKLLPKAEQKIARIQRQFQMYDVDGSGTIELDEFKLMLRDLCVPLHSDEVNASFAKLDTDGSGEIDYQEFERWYTGEGEKQGKQMRLARLKMKSERAIRDARGITDTTAAKHAIVARALNKTHSKLKAMFRQEYPLELTEDEYDTYRINNPGAAHDNEATGEEKKYDAPDADKVAALDKELEHVNDSILEAEENGDNNADDGDADETVPMTAEEISAAAELKSISKSEEDVKPPVVPLGAGGVLSASDEGVPLPPSIANLNLGELLEGGEYVGELNAAGQKHGYGVAKSKDGTQVFGSFVDGKVDGYGVLSLPEDGGRYEGKFSNNRVTGYGFFYPGGKK
eukprot:g556.t1